MTKGTKIVDVFAGVGGLSLGAARAGFHVAAAIELDSKALETHKKNFPKTKHLANDVASLSGKQLLCDIGKIQIDGLIGGPPCQGFSNIGHRNRKDPRNSLFLEFFRLVAEIKPAFFVAENVPGVLDDRNKFVRERAYDQIPSRYRLLDPISVCANEYGAPTVRTRIFFIGYDPERLSPLAIDDFKPDKRISDVRVAHALKELPSLRANWNTEAESWRAVGVLGNSAYEKRIKGFVPDGVGDSDALSRYKTKKLVSGFLGDHSRRCDN